MRFPKVHRDLHSLRRCRLELCAMPGVERVGAGGGGGWIWETKVVTNKAASSLGVRGAGANLWGRGRKGREWWTWGRRSQDPGEAGVPDARV